MAEQPFEQFLGGIESGLAANAIGGAIGYLYKEWRKTQDIDRLLAIVDEQDHKEFTVQIKDDLKALIESHRSQVGKDRDNQDAVFRMLVNLKDDVQRKFPYLDTKQLDYNQTDQDQGLLPSAMLRAEYGLVPFIERENELKDIHAWCEEKRPLALRLYTGAGGMGKTRFLIQACKELRDKQWKAGFLRDGDDARLLDLTFGTQKPVLVVLDYAERRSAAVERILDEFSQNRETPKIRVVLLARSEGDWWKAIGRENSDVKRFMQTRSVEGPIELQPLSTNPVKRLEVFEEALKAYRKVLPPNTTVLGTPDLKDKKYDRVLVIHMAALAVADGHLFDDEKKLMEHLLDREENFLLSCLKKKGFDAGYQAPLLQAAVLSTLLGGADSPEHAIALVRRAPRVAAPPTKDAETLAVLLMEVYPGRNEDGSRRLCGVEPDLFGEYMACRWLKDKKDTTLLSLATQEDWGKKAVNHTLTVLTRIAQRRKEDGETWLKQTLALDLERLLPLVLDVAQETGDPIGQVAAKVLERYSTKDEEQQKRAVELAILIYGKLPNQTTSLRELAMVVTKILHQAAKIWLDAGESEAQEEVAGYANNLAARLSELGHREDALAAIEEATTIYRKLAQARPDAFLPNLATALNNISVDYSNLGRMEDALQATQEAVTIYKRLANQRPDAFLPDLAMALNNLGIRYSDLGRREDALQATQEALTIRRKLAKERPDAFLHDLAMALNNLGAMYSDLGRREDALQATQEAVTIYKRLANQRPDAFLPDLAMALNNLGAMYSNLGRREDALQATQDAVAIYRRLAQQRPDAFLPNLASVLNNLGIRYSNLGRREDALKATEEAVTIRRKLANERPDAFLPDLADSLNNLGIWYSDLGHREDALQATQDALTIYRKLAEQRPDAFLPNLASALNNLGVMYSNLGRREDALQATQDAVAIYRKLAEARPDAFLPNLAMVLNNLGAMYSNLGRREDALQATQDAVTIYRKLAQARPDAFLSDLAMALNNLGIRYSNLGRREDALQATEEAVTIRRKLAKERPDAFLPDLAKALNNLGIWYSNLGRREEALQATEEALTIYRNLAQARPDAFLSDLAMSINNLGMMLSNLGQREDALAATEEALAIYRKLTKVRPDAFLPDLAMALNNLGIRYSDLGRREDALQATLEAVRILSPLFLHLPQAFGNRMEVFVRNYIKQCQALNQTPDTALLSPILAKLEELKEG